MPVRFPLRPWLLACIAVIAATRSGTAADNGKPTAFPFQDGDRVAWIGSSSTRIGVWPKTMEFLLRTRHPQVKLTFERFTTGGGTFATGLQNLDKWLDPFKPTVVFYNYGGNDAGAGEKGLPQFKENVEKAVSRARAAGARVLLMTPQAADVRKAGEEPAARRKLYAETLVKLGKEKGWPVIDVHTPLAELQKGGEKDDDAYTILKDKIHLTDPAYIGWGYYLYDRLGPPSSESSATITAAGEVAATHGCKIEDIKADKDGVAFTRIDEVLPILPPVPLPPRKYVPLERLSAYLLKVPGLAAGDYSISCDGKPVGPATAKALAEGVNLNTLLLDSGNKAPWDDLAQQLWAGKGAEQVGKTRWRFEVRKR